MVIPIDQPGRKTNIQGPNIDSTRPCQFKRRSRPPQPLPLSWHSFFKSFIKQDFNHKLLKINIIESGHTCAIITGNKGLRFRITMAAKDPKEMTEQEILRRIIRLGFDGDDLLYQKFCDRLRAWLPAGTGVALRGSVLTAERWADGEPFDADGPRTSDLDVTLVGSSVMEYWLEDEYYIPGLHTKPLGDKAPHIAPPLNPLRVELQRMVGRPVNIQATSNLILYVRDVLFDQPYFMLFEAQEEEA